MSDLATSRQLRILNSLRTRSAIPETFPDPEFKSRVTRDLTQSRTTCLQIATFLLLLTEGS